MKFKEAKKIVEMLGNEWDLGKKDSVAKGNICAWIYFLEILECSEKIILEKKDNKVIGICGYYKQGGKKYFLRKKFYKILKNILKNSIWIKNKKALANYYENYDYTPDELKKKCDGEISILIVDEKYRNLGIGKKLITKTFNLAKKDGLKSIQILTDESCNFEFYSNIGCIKIFEKKIYNKENSKCGKKDYEVGYIFEKQLS